MSSKRTRIGFTPVVLAIFSIALLGGCTHTDSVALEAFVTDILRGVASALLL